MGSGEGEPQVGTWEGEDSWRRKRRAWELEKAYSIGSIEIEKERLHLARDKEDSRIMLADASLLDVEAKKCLGSRKKEINERKEYEAGRAAVAAAEAEWAVAAAKVARMAYDE